MMFAWEVDKFQNICGCDILRLDPRTFSMASSVSVPLALSLSSSTSSEGGCMKTYRTPSRLDSFTDFTPCTSMSRMQTFRFWEDKKYLISNSKTIDFSI